MKNRCLLVVLLAIAFAPHSLAWGPTGHRVVAEIAQRHLLPAARDSVGRLLGGRSLADVVNWPDELRSDPRFDKYKPLHFATVPDGVNSYRDAKKDKCGDLVVAIAALSNFLRTGARDDLFAVKALTDKSDGTAKGACNPRETDPISPDTALRLAQVTGMSADFWLGLQQDWDLWHAVRSEEAVKIGRLTRLPRVG